MRVEEPTENGAGALDALREEQVASLRAAIAQGSYRPDMHEVARRFLREVLGQLLA
ncbi:MAG TPA: flagellar biosynthesis anti-sigma factor FlgM [Candidatus Limnocylindria bacterium]|jgi:anti-sigma28 factor (negative regulator of flagellin synthesis)|nr:flagellar biosynthesis anti-sigma factor FlgM [Candidatus Limnocylindria bacterium]